MSYILGPSQSFKGPDFLISLIEPLTVSLSPQTLRARNFEGHWSEGPPYFNPCLDSSDETGSKFFSWCDSLNVWVDQAFPTRGPRAACGPQDNFVRPAKSNALIQICYINELSKENILFYDTVVQLIHCGHGC